MMLRLTLNCYSAMTKSNVTSTLLPRILMSNLDRTSKLTNGVCTYIQPCQKCNATDQINAICNEIASIPYKFFVFIMVSPVFLTDDVNLNRKTLLDLSSAVSSSNCFHNFGILTRKDKWKYTMALHSLLIIINLCGGTSLTQILISATTCHLLAGLSRSL